MHSDIYKDRASALPNQLPHIFLFSIKQGIDVTQKLSMTKKTSRDAARLEQLLPPAPTAATRPFLSSRRPVSQSHFRVYCNHLGSLIK